MKQISPGGVMYKIVTIFNNTGVWNLLQNNSVIEGGSGEKQVG